MTRINEWSTKLKHRMGILDEDHCQTTSIDRQDFIETPVIIFNELYRKKYEKMVGEDLPFSRDS